jgi:hypothetical protein
MIDGTDTNAIVIMSMCMSQPCTSLATTTGDDDIVDDVSMVDP